MPAPHDVRRTSTQALSLALVVIGVALIVRTAVAGGGGLAVGFIFGVLFIAAGAGRFWVSRRSG